MSTKIAVVTGAASGMGRCAAERLIRSGWTVAAVDLPGAGLDELAAAGRGDGPSRATSPTPHRWPRRAQDVLQRLGGVTRLVNAAGIALRGRIDELPAEAFSRSMAVNYMGTVHWVKAVLPSMQKRRQGEIALFASLAGWLPTPAMGAYTATKFAVVGFAETLGMELRGSGLKVRCVCPAAVQTPMLDTIMGAGSSRTPQETRRCGHTGVGGRRHRELPAAATDIRLRVPGCVDQGALAPAAPRPRTTRCRGPCSQRLAGQPEQVQLHSERVHHHKRQSSQEHDGGQHQAGHQRHGIRVLRRSSRRPAPRTAPATVPSCECRSTFAGRVRRPGACGSRCARRNLPRTPRTR